MRLQPSLQTKEPLPPASLFAPAKRAFLTTTPHPNFLHRRRSASALAPEVPPRSACPFSDFHSATTRKFLHPSLPAPARCAGWAFSAAPARLLRGISHNDLQTLFSPRQSLPPARHRDSYERDPLREHASAKIRQRPGQGSMRQPQAKLHFAGL